MKNISDFFSIFKNKATEEIQRRLYVSEIVKKITNIDIDIKNIKILNGIVILNTSQIVKNEILIKKPRILAELKETIKDKISDIK